MESSEGKNVLSEFLREVKVGQENVLDVSREVLGEGKDKITFAVQNRVLQPEPPLPPERVESPPRQHVFHTAESAAAYLAAGYASEHTVALADAVAQRIGITLDERAIGGVEVCSVTPVLHPIFEPWAVLMKQGPLDLREAVSFLQQHRREIIEPAGRELALDLGQIKASTEIEAHFGTPGKGRDAINGLMVTTRIKGQDQTSPVDLPEFIIIECPLFVGSVARRIEIDLTMAATEAGAVVVMFTSTALTAAVMEEFNAMLDTLAAKLPEGGVAALGRVSYGAGWDYLETGKGGDR